MAFQPANFALLEPQQANYESARAVILPVPFERTTSYGKGTIGGPAAILAASHQLELYDEELQREPAELGIHTLPLFQPESFDLAEALEEVQEEARKHLDAGKFLVTLGGEHSLSLAPVRATAASHGDAVGVVQFDAHADLREEFEGTPYSHASVLRRIVEDGAPTLAVGIRSLSSPEAQLVKARKLPVIWGYELEERGDELFDRFLEQLPEAVYLTFDLDFFDPSLVPATGTPEPGGGRWWPTLRMLRRLFATKRVLAMDVVELAPIGGQPASDFLAAKLVYKCLGYLAEAESSAS
ncbi:MAG: agmatinase [Acidobacteriota bacterium]|nr:agmatinase [Acidobacteriota bacterium]